MSKYDKLWEYVQHDGRDSFTLTFDQIGDIAGVPLDHSFLNCKKELNAHGYEVGHIHLKDEFVEFHKLPQGSALWK